MRFKRAYSMFAPAYTYEVYTDADAWIGAVARNAGEDCWHASTRTWTGGRDLPGTFPSRNSAAQALVMERRP